MLPKMQGWMDAKVFLTESNSPGICRQETPHYEEVVKSVPGKEEVLMAKKMSNRTTEVIKMKQQKKGKFFTFIFSFIPGAAEMYMGFMKQGVSLMADFNLLSDAFCFPCGR